MHAEVQTQNVLAVLESPSHFKTLTTIARPSRAEADGMRSLGAAGPG
jgi:hypothetical protein